MSLMFTVEDNLFYFFCDGRMRFGGGEWGDNWLWLYWLFQKFWSMGLLLELMDNYFEKIIYIIEWIAFKNIVFMVVDVNLYS